LVFRQCHESDSFEGASIDRRVICSRPCTLARLSRGI
jgi:hypothetical protein